MYPGAGPMGGMPPNQPGQHGMGPSPMNSPMQQQRRIDPDQMPSPVSAILFLLFLFFLKRLVSGTQQLILLTLLIIRLVSSVQKDFVRDSNKISKGN